METWVTVMTGVNPSFMVRVFFRAILLCLILNQVLVAHYYILEPKLRVPLDGCIYKLTVGRVLNTNVFQINQGKLLFRATVKVTLGSCLSTALEMDNWTVTLSTWLLSPIRPGRRPRDVGLRNEYTLFKVPTTK